MANVKNVTVKELTEELIEVAKKSYEDENLTSRINYTLKALNEGKKVTKSDLLDLIGDTKTATVKAPVENSVKPAKKGLKKPAEKTTEKKKETTTEKTESAEAPVTAETKTEDKKAPAKKGLKKPVEKKEEPSSVETTDDGLNSKTLPMAKIFPQTLDHEDFGKLVACPDKYKTMDEVREALNEGKNLVFATYWTKRHIKQYGYAQYLDVPVNSVKNGFKHDLDMLQVLYVCESIDRLHAISTYTEAMLCFNGADLVPVEVTANDGSKFMMRYSAGMEFEIYEEAPAKEDSKSEKNSKKVK